MKTCTIKMIIPFLFIFLYFINSSSAYSCDIISCPRRLNSSIYATEASVRSPFRLKAMQAEGCGYEGFDLYCDDTLGTLIQLPNNVVLHVDEIYYFSNLLILSDPYNHSLTQKLLSFDLDDTPFRPANDHSIFINSEKYWLYNCSILDFYDDNLYNRIDCLSGSGYTIISAESETTSVPYSNSCTFLKVLTVASFGMASSPRLCTLSDIVLTWSSDQKVPSDYEREHSNSYVSSPGKVVGPLMGGLIPFAIMLCCCLRCWCRRNAQVTTSTMNNQSRAVGTATYAVTGLDQVTIDSYPVVVVGASGRVIKPDDTTCPICLSDYCPQETLKILPECIHRFHADCIDEWLRSKGVCPICRTSTPQTSSNH